ICNRDTGKARQMTGSDNGIGGKGGAKAVRNSRKTSNRQDRMVMEAVEARVLLAAHGVAHALIAHAITPAISMPSLPGGLHVSSVSQGAAVTTSAGTTTYAVNAAATTVDPTLTVTANAGATFTTATAQVATNYHNGEDQFSLPGLIGGTAAFDVATGTLTVTFSSASTAA